MKQIVIVKTLCHEDFDEHEEHESRVNDWLKNLQTEHDCTILNVSTIINNKNELITTIYYDTQTT